LVVTDQRIGLAKVQKTGRKSRCSGKERKAGCTSARDWKTCQN